MTPATHTIILTAADGRLLSTQVTLEPDRQYHPDNLAISHTAPEHQLGRILTIACAELPNEQEFRVVAARAAIRAARTGRDGQKLTDLLVPI